MMILDSDLPEKLLRRSILGVIPARLASTRLSRKVLRLIAGRPMLLWVYEAAHACPQLDQVVVATDSKEVADLCHRHAVPVALTSPDLASGSDRVHAIAHVDPFDAFDIYVNIQADEPLLRPDHITALLRPFARADVDVTTLKVPCTPENVDKPNVVKVVTAIDGRALYFSRATIPFHRDPAASDSNVHAIWKHIGLYAYRRAALERFHSLPPSPLEQTERLEQLRLLENNISLYVEPTSHDTIGVDTEADLVTVEAILQSRTPIA